MKIGGKESTTMKWSTQCELVDAACSPEPFAPGLGVLLDKRPYERVYEFSNGRRFADRRNPYQTFADNE